MEYAIYGKTGLKVSRLGFGCMRLPMKSKEEVDRDKAIPLLRRAFEMGINYFDTAVGYCGGDSQRVLGEVTEDIRGKVVLSTKNHHYDKHDKAGWWKNLEDSLERLRTDHIDVYNFHFMTIENFERGVVGEDGLYKEMLKAREQGLIHHICHSYHGPCEGLMKCIDSGLFEGIIVQYNLLDRHLEEGIAHAAQCGMGVTIMGPVGGGRLGYPSEKASELIGDVKSTPDLALRFVLSNPNVTAALSGMSTMEMLEENVETVSRATKLTQEDHDRIEAAIQERKEFLGLYCTGCGYCMPCPEGVDIPANFEILNMERIFGLTDHARSRYARLAGKAALCRLCGKCLEPCPQDLDIPARLAETVAALDSRAGTVAGWSELRGGSLDRRGMVHVNLRYHLKNFTDQQQKAKVEFHPHGEDRISPERFRFDKLRPYARRHKDVEVVVRPSSQALDLDAVVTYDGTQALAHLHHVVTVARKARGYKLDPSARRGGALHVPSALHPIHGSDQNVAGHSFDFAAAYDKQNLYVYADVEEDLRFPAREKIVGRKRADNLCIFLDGRKTSELGRGGYEQGVMNVAIYPAAEEKDEPQVRTSNDADVAVRLARTPCGYRVDCAIPWEVFSQVDGTPSVIGFDIGINSHDEDGKDVLRLTWTGRSRQERNPGAFGTLLLV